MNASYSLLQIADLTEQNGHAVQQVVLQIQQSLQCAWPRSQMVQGQRIVSAAHNYALLGYSPDAIVQSAEHTHWVNDTHLLRTQTTSLILEELQKQALRPTPCTLLAPGIVYRRDVRDRWHCGQPHQMDVWVLLPKEQESPELLRKLIQDICRASIGNTSYRLSSTQHPYTQQGVEIEARWEDRWLEIGEAGLIDQALLQRIGIDPDQWGGLALGMGLDRLVMVRKGLPDIRLLRDSDTRVQKQMQNLEPWKDVSRQPAARRTLSIARAACESEEALTESVLRAAGSQAPNLEAITIAGRWKRVELEENARERLGILEGQENIFLELTWRHPTQSMPRATINEATRKIYKAIHQGASLSYCP